MQAVSLKRVGGDVEAAELAGRLREMGIEAAITSLGQQLHVRVSVQAYVGVAAFDRLAGALDELLKA